MAQKKSIPEELKINIINYLSGKWEECDSKLLTAWLEESEENRRLFGQLTDFWEADRMMRRENDFDTDKAWNRLELKMDSRPAILKRFYGFSQITQYAAILVLGLLLGSLAYSFYRNQADADFTASNLIEYTVPRGSKTSLKLLDGSVVRLNAGTIIKYNQEFGKQNRDIELSGEAFFEVAKSKDLPFVVNAKHVLVQALGTKFNVKAYPEEKTVETILLEGSVKLEQSGSDSHERLILKPDQKAVFNSENNNFLVSAIDNASEVSWFTDKWVIKNTKLGEFAKLLERRYNIVITFDDDRIRNYEFGGTIKEETIEQVLTAITYSAPLKYQIINKQVTLFLDENKVGQYNNLLK